MELGSYMVQDGELSNSLLLVQGFKEALSQRR